MPAVEKSSLIVWSLAAGMNGGIPGHGMQRNSIFSIITAFTGLIDDDEWHFMNILYEGIGL
jgi:hypothetical protein